MKATQILGQISVLFLASALLIFISCSRQTQAPQPEKLNILFILVDDLNTRLGTYGDPVVQSPNIDQLAAAGLRFDRAYVQYPMCNASRSSLLSGLYPELTGVLGNRDQLREAVGDIALMPEFFRYHGYYAHGVGKIAHRAKSVSWGAPLDGDPVPPGVAARKLRKAARSNQKNPLLGDKEIKVDASEEDDPSSPLELQAPSPSGNRIRTPNTSDDNPLRDEHTTTSAIRWLEAHRDKPFFLAVGLTSTHLPFGSQRSYIDKYPPYTIQLRQEPPGHLARVPAIALTRHPGDDMTDLERRTVMSHYFACVTYVDEQVRRLLATLEQLDLRDSTAIVLTSDHGFLLGEHGNHWRKGALFDESIRVPLIVAGPGISPGATSSQPAELLDLYPTLVELAGLPRPKGLQGLSLVDQLHGSAKWRDRPTYTVVSRGTRLVGRSIQTDRFRYTEWGSDDLAELYDHRNDPFEYQNLLAGQHGPKKLQRYLRSTLRSTRKRSLSLPSRKARMAAKANRQEAQSD